MTRSPSIPCARCGRLLWRGGRDKGPITGRICLPCRRAQPAPYGPKAGVAGTGEQRPLKLRDCALCGEPFAIRCEAVKTLTCSISCGQKLRYQRESCEHCGQQGPKCPCVQARRRAHYRAKNSARRGLLPPSRVLTIEELGERDGWRCHLCRRQVNRNLRSPHPRSPTFDHLIPVSRDGTDEPENLALAHRVCNTRRGVRGVVQLALIG